MEFDEDDAGGRRVLKIADGFEVLVGFFQLGGGAFHVDEEGVGVHGFVVAHPGDVQVQRGEAPAGLEKGADVVGHGGDVAFFHGESPKEKGL